MWQFSILLLLHKEWLQGSAFGTVGDRLWFMLEEAKVYTGMAVEILCGGGSVKPLQSLLYFQYKQNK